MKKLHYLYISVATFLLGFSLLISSFFIHNNNIAKIDDDNIPSVTYLKEIKLIQINEGVLAIGTLKNTKNKDIEIVIHFDIMVSFPGLASGYDSIQTEKIIIKANSQYNLSSTMTTRAKYASTIRTYTDSNSSIPYYWDFYESYTPKIKNILWIFSIPTLVLFEVFIVLFILFNTKNNYKK